LFVNSIESEESPASGRTMTASPTEIAGQISHFILSLEKLAERGGFEPPVRYKPTHAFQACALNRSAISPANHPNLKNRSGVSNNSHGDVAEPY
jgi:hypothetical protein